MHRLFVAIRPPRAIRDALLGIRPPLPGARWQDDDQLHLTLRFIGEVDHHQADDIDAALRQIRATALTLMLGRLGQFDHRGRADALWIGVGPPEPLERLHNKIDQTLVRTGLAPERRAFVPHITLARLGRGVPPLGGLVGAQPLGMRSFEADAFGLFESELGHGGATYTMVERYPLAPSASASATAPALTSAQVSSKRASSP